MLKKLKLKNYQISPSVKINGNHVNIDIHNFIKHYLDEHVPNFDPDDRDYYISFFKKRLLPGNYFSFLPETESEVPELKRDFAASYGRAIARSLLDVYCGISFFDHFSGYQRDTDSRQRYVSNNLFAELKQEKQGIPFFIASDTTSRLYTVEANGRSSNYYKKELISYIAVTQNAILKNAKDEEIRSTGWTIPSYIASGATNSSCSMIDTNIEGSVNADTKDFSVFRGHYRKVFHNLNHPGLTNYLHGSLSAYGEEFSRSMLVGRMLMGSQYRWFLIEPITFDCHTELLYRMNLPDPIFEDQTRRRNLVYGLELETAKSISLAASRGSSEFQATFRVLNQFDVNASTILGLSSDGTIVAPLNHFDRLRYIDL